MSCLATRSMPPMRLQPGIMRFSSLQYGFCAPGLDKDKVAPGATAWAHPQAMQRLERPVPPLPQTLLHWCWHHLPSRQRQPSGCAYLLGCPLPLLPVPHQSANANPQCTEVKEETGTNVVRRTFWPAACGCSGSTMRGRCWPAWLLPRSNQDWRMAGVTADARWRAGTFSMMARQATCTAVLEPICLIARAHQGVYITRSNPATSCHLAGSADAVIALCYHRMEGESQRRL